MLFVRGMLCVAAAMVASLGCKGGKSAEPDNAIPRLDGKKLTLTPCQLGTTEDLDSLFVDQHGAISLIDRYGNARRTKPGGGPCGLVAGDLVKSPLTFDASGALVTATTDDGGSGGVACQSDGFALYKTHMVWLGGNRLLWHDAFGTVGASNGNASVTLEDRSGKPCKRSLFSTTVPSAIDRITVGPDAVFIHPRTDRREVDGSLWRYKPDGTLIDKTFGQSDGEVDIRRFFEDIVPCGAGACASSAFNDRFVKFAIYDAQGKAIALYHLVRTQGAIQAFNVPVTTTGVPDDEPKTPKSDDFRLRGLVVTGSTAYVLAESRTSESSHVVDLVRIDGVFAK